jgi:hypothetical protein
MLSKSINDTFSFFFQIQSFGDAAYAHVTSHQSVISEPTANKSFTVDETG